LKINTEQDRQLETLKSSYRKQARSKL